VSDGRRGRRRCAPGHQTRVAKRGRATLRVAAYWLTVIAVACVMAFLLLLFLESRDESTVGGGAIRGWRVDGESFATVARQRRLGPLRGSRCRVGDDDVKPS
jgi:hypothetical protein